LTSAPPDPLLEYTYLFTESIYLVGWVEKRNLEVRNPGDFPPVVRCTNWADGWQPARDKLAPPSVRKKPLGVPGAEVIYRKRWKSRYQYLATTGPPK
jgi:hypothetical protein